MNNKPRPKESLTSASAALANGPRPKQTMTAPTVNAPRAPNQMASRPALNKVTMKQEQNLTEMLRARSTQGQKHPGAKMQAQSQKRLDTENAYIYDRMSKNALTGNWHDFKQMVNPLSGTTKASREELRKQGADLKGIKKDVKAHNPEATRHETNAKNAKYVKTGASMVGTAATGVAMINPLAGAVTKGVATGVGIGAGLVAVDQFRKAAKDHAAAVDDKATGDKMFMSNISGAAAGLNTKRADHELMSTAFSGVTSLTGGATGAVLQGTTEAARIGIGAAHSAIKNTGTQVTKHMMEQDEASYKSDIINNMKHLASRNVAKPGLIIPPRAKVIDKSPPPLKRQDAMSNVNQGAGAHLQRQDASRNLTKK